MPDWASTAGWTADDWAALLGAAGFVVIVAALTVAQVSGALVDRLFAEED